jgi:hypothetical protein
MFNNFLPKIQLSNCSINPPNPCSWTRSVTNPCWHLITVVQFETSYIFWIKTRIILNNKIRCKLVSLANFWLETSIHITVSSWQSVDLLQRPKLMWSLSLSDLINDFVHFKQIYGFSSLWTLKCEHKVTNWENDIVHWWQVY